MRPGDHPEFFRLAPPPGASRESTIRLDREGRFWHDGGLVEKRSLADALHAWLRRHPDDGRYILENGYDWCYLAVEDTPCFVVTVRPGEPPVLVLAGGSEEPLDPEAVTVDDEGALFTHVRGGAFEARFGRLAQTELARYLADDEPVRLVVGGREHPVGRRRRPAGDGAAG